MSIFFFVKKSKIKKKYNMYVHFFTVAIGVRLDAFFSIVAFLIYLFIYRFLLLVVFFVL
jgi:hypothetical protein